MHFTVYSIQILLIQSAIRSASLAAQVTAFLELVHNSDACISLRDLNCIGGNYEQYSQGRHGMGGERCQEGLCIQLHAKVDIDKSNCLIIVCDELASWANITNYKACGQKYKLPYRLAQYASHYTIHDGTVRCKSGQLDSLEFICGHSEGVVCTWIHECFIIN